MPGKVITPSQMSKMLYGSNEHYYYLESLRAVGAWPPKGDEKVSPLPPSEKKTQPRRKTDCMKMCCDEEHPPVYQGIMNSEENPVYEDTNYYGWVKVLGKRRKYLKKSVYEDEAEE